MANKNTVVDGKTAPANSKRPTQARQLTDDNAPKVWHLQEILDWYKTNGTKVNSVTCNECGEIVAIEASMPGSGQNPNHDLGMTVVPITGKLMSYRLRLDGSIGYSCSCGNSSIVLDEEAELLDGVTPAPHIIDDIKKRIAGNNGKPKKAAQFKRAKVK